MIKTYSKKSDYSYALGVSPTIDLLENRAGDVVSVVINPKGMKNAGVLKIIKRCEELHISIKSNQKLVEKLSSIENTYAIGEFKKYTTTLNPENNHIVLSSPSNMGNLGTICRTMLAFDFVDLAIIKPAADIFDPKVIRTSMGAIFSLNFEYFDSFEGYQSKFRHNTYAFMCDGETLLDKVVFRKPYSLVFGNEGDGLNQKYKEIGESIKIPQSIRVDSFNLSVAVGISLYATREKF
jgi:RNA methyltransferase, TrmH family